MDRLVWVKNFISTEQFAPFVVERDEQYYSELNKKFRSVINSAKEAGADEESIKILEKYSTKIKEAIRAYYNGRISTSHNIVKNLVLKCSDDSLAVSRLDDSYAFPGTRGTEIQLFRARLSDEVHTFEAKEMLHLPLSLRGKTGNYRFSIPGIPSLYLGNSSYACWIELGRPAEHRFNVSPVVLDGTQKIFNLAVMTRSLFYLNELEEKRVHCWLKLLMLMIATSYTVKEPDRTFKSEYIVSQSIMLACKELGYDGVAYFSKRVSDEFFAYAAINLALFAPYERGKNYSSICEHIKVEDSFNYSLYKQVGNRYASRGYDLRLIHTGIITNIGSYKKGRQFSYAETEFCRFDRFLFSSWEEKDEVEWGNALKE